MNLLDAKEGEEYIIKSILSNDEELEAFSNWVSPKCLPKGTSQIVCGTNWDVN